MTVRPGAWEGSTESRRCSQIRTLCGRFFQPAGSQFLGNFPCSCPKFQGQTSMKSVNNTCVHAWLGQTIDHKIQKDQKPNCHSKSRVQCLPPAPLHMIPPKGLAKHLNYPSSPTHGSARNLTHKRNQLTVPLSGNKQGNLLLAFALSCCSRGPTALPELCACLLVNFY